MSKKSVKREEALKELDDLGVFVIFPQALQDQLSKIDNISYAEKIFIAKDRSDVNIFDKVYKSLEGLWVQKYGLDDCFEIFKIYREFEPILFKGGRYRDHFVHQYLVFLTGLPIISQFKPNIATYFSQIDGIAEKLINIEKSWLIASTFHDIGYPIQRLDGWLKIFFTDFLNIKTKPLYIDMSLILHERNYLLNLYKLSEYLYKLYRMDNPMLEQDYLHVFWSKKFLEKNHGVLSSLILLDKYEISIGPGSKKFSQATFLSQILPSAVAIALHDSEVYTEEIIPQIIFEKDPISFILTYSDTVQEWGRPVAPNIIQQPSYIPLLTRYDVDNQKVSVTLTYKIVEEVPLRDGTKSTNFDEKKKEISSLFSKLKSSSVRFEIVLKSIDAEFGYKTFVEGTKDD